MVDITLFASEVGEILGFDVRIGGGPPDLIGSAAACSLVVPGNGRSPFALVNNAQVTGRAEYVVAAGDFPQGRYDECYVQYVAGGKTLRTDPFTVFSK